jgi:chromosome segregation ATPase
MNRSQKEVLNLQKKVEDSLRREEELHQKMKDMRLSQELLKAEADSVNALSLNEKQTLQKLREEHRELNLEIRKKKEELKMTFQELQGMQGDVQGLRVELGHLDDIRTEMVREIDRLREASRSELKRTEKMEQTCSSVEERLRMLKAEIASSEASYEKVCAAGYLSVDRDERVKDLFHLTR